MDEMDRKHKFDRKTIIKPLEKETSKMLRDLELAREHEDIENLHEKIFDGIDGGIIDMETFNTAFDSLYKTQDDLVLHSGNPEPWNKVVESNFGNVENYEDLYIDDEQTDFGTIYSSINFEKTKKTKKITKKDVEKLKPATYTKGHNIIEKNYHKNLEEKLRERNLETRKYDERSLNDFENDPTFGGYGITNQLGLDAISSLTWENEEDLKTKYNKLLELRKNELVTE